MRLLALLLILLAAALWRPGPAAAAGCGPGYIVVSHDCVPIKVPQHAHIAMNGGGWSCDFGYERHGEVCGPVIVPRNATLGKNSDVWSCNRGYYEIRGICLPDERAEARAGSSSRAPLDLKAARAAAGQQLDAMRDVGAVALALVIVIALLGMAVRRQEPATTSHIPTAHSFRPRAIPVLVDTWASWGEAIDGLTGGPIAEGLPVIQCSVCQAHYGTESVAVLRRENRGRCLACGSRLVRRGSQTKFQTLVDTSRDPGRLLPAPTR